MSTSEKKGFQTSYDYWYRCGWWRLSMCKETKYKYVRDRLELIFRFLYSMITRKLIQTIVNKNIINIELSFKIRTRYRTTYTTTYRTTYDTTYSSQKKCCSDYSDSNESGECLRE